MIRNVRIANYKSITEMALRLGRLTVLIGANGSGKSNILEAIALASASSQYKIDNEFLASRGIRVTETRFMRTAFSPTRATSTDKQNAAANERVAGAKRADPFENSIELSVEFDQEPTFTCYVSPDESVSYPKLTSSVSLRVSEMQQILEKLKDEKFPSDAEIGPDIWQRFLTPKWGTLPTFLIYGPENSTLRTFQAEGQILPLGRSGEGLFAHLKNLDTEINEDRLVKIKETLRLLDWELITHGILRPAIVGELGNADVRVMRWDGRPRQRQAIQRGDGGACGRCIASGIKGPHRHCVLAVPDGARVKVPGEWPRCG